MQVAPVFIFMDNVSIRAIGMQCMLLLCVTAAPQESRVASTTALPSINAKPYRVLLVVERESDPYDLLVSSETDKFQPVAALLKAACKPAELGNPMLLAVHGVHPAFCRPAWLLLMC
jgi:hypothetical protein